MKKKNLIFIFIFNVLIILTSCDSGIEKSSPSGAVAEIASPKNEEEESQSGDIAAYLGRGAGAIALPKKIKKKRQSQAQRKSLASNRNEGVKISVFESVYGLLFEFGTERKGYGLYTYVLIPRHSARAQRFFEELFKTTSSEKESKIKPENLNLIYIPVKFTNLANVLDDNTEISASMLTEEIYDSAMARVFLAKICKNPEKIVKNVCATDLTRGPYLFTYTSPASTLSLVPPPYLFVDLSNVHERAFSEFISAYKAQIKRTDYTDLRRIDNLRLRILNLVLTAADLINPMKDAIADILYMAKGEKEKNSNQIIASPTPKPKDTQMGGTID